MRRDGRRVDLDLGRREEDSPGKEVVSDDDDDDDDEEMLDFTWSGLALVAFPICIS